MVPMEIVGVQQVAVNTPAMLLRESGGEGRVVPILIGTNEASSILAAMEGIVPPRPLTHDLAVTLLTVLGASLERVVITEVRDHTFYAELHLTTAQGGDAVVSARPSDAVALAVRVGSPVFAADELVAAVGQAADLDEDDDEDDESILEEFRDFLDDLDPDDFAS